MVNLRCLALLEVLMGFLGVLWIFLLWKGILIFCMFVFGQEAGCGCDSGGFLVLCFGNFLLLVCDCGYGYVVVCSCDFFVNTTTFSLLFSLKVIK